LNFRLGACSSDWISLVCATADQLRTALGVYDQVVDVAQQHGLKIIGLISNEAWHGSQAQWTVNNAESAGGSGDNAYVRAFATNAAGVLAQQAGTVVSSKQNTEHVSTDQIVADIQAHLIPGGLLIPAAVGELVRPHDKGYRLVANGSLLLQEIELERMTGSDCV
jgi:hypothetical protein